VLIPEPVVVAGDDRLLGTLQCLLAIQLLELRLRLDQASNLVAETRQAGEVNVFVNAPLGRCFGPTTAPPFRRDKWAYSTGESRCPRILAPTLVGLAIARWRGQPSTLLGGHSCASLR
jgi:hypothetical protein